MKDSGTFNVAAARQTLLAEAAKVIETAKAEDLLILGRTPRTAVMMAGLIENVYTCAETIFVRISQYFENPCRIQHIGPF